MSLSSGPSSPGVTVVYVDYEGDEGEKAIFGSVRRMITRVGTLDASDLADNLEEFCRQMGAVFERVTTTIHRDRGRRSSQSRSACSGSAWRHR